MSSHPVRSRWLLVPTLLLAASAGASARGARAHIADASAIIPVMDVAPQVFPLAHDPPLLGAHLHPALRVSVEPLTILR